MRKLLDSWLASNPLYDVVVVWAMTLCSYVVWMMGRARTWDAATLGVVLGQFGLAVFGHVLGNRNNRTNGGGP